MEPAQGEEKEVATTPELCSTKASNYCWAFIMARIFAASHSFPATFPAGTAPATGGGAAGEATKVGTAAEGTAAAKLGGGCTGGTTAGGGGCTGATGPAAMARVGGSTTGAAAGDGIAGAAAADGTAGAGDGIAGATATAGACCTAATGAALAKALHSLMALAEKHMPLAARAVVDVTHRHAPTLFVTGTHVVPHMDSYLGDGPGDVIASFSVFGPGGLLVFGPEQNPADKFACRWIRTGTLFFMWGQRRWHWDHAVFMDLENNQHHALPTDENATFSQEAFRGVAVLRWGTGSSREKYSVREVETVVVNDEDEDWTAGV